MQKNVKIFVVLIALITLVSGLIQIIVPSMVLEFIGAEVSRYTRHLFSIIGMFMALFGGMMLQAVYSVRDNKAAVLWSALQKIGAALAVGIGVLNGLFATIALAVALFDAFSGLVLFYYLYSLKEL